MIILKLIATLDNLLLKLLEFPNSYIPKDKLDEYIIRGATYSTKFVPLMNEGAEGTKYTNIMG